MKNPNKIAKKIKIFREKQCNNYINIKIIMLFFDKKIA